MNVGFGGMSPVGVVFFILALPLLLGGCSLLESGAELYPGGKTPAITILYSCPEDGYEDVNRDGVIFARFSGPLDPTTVTLGNVLLGSGREAQRGRVLYDPERFTIYYRPYERLRPSIVYDLYFTDSLRDAAGGRLFTETVAIRFTTGSPGGVQCPDDPLNPPPRPPAWCAEREDACELEADADPPTENSDNGPGDDSGNDPGNEPDEHSTDESATGD